MMATEAQIERTAREWTALAGGIPVRVEQVGSVLYGFGEELAALRVYHKMGAGRVAYSTNLHTWFFAIDL